MPLGIGAALLISSAVGAGTQIAGAKIASGAAKKAAATQSASAEKALQVGRDVYQQQRQDQNPYMQAGTQSLANLQQIVGNQQPRYGGGMQPGGPQQPPPNLGGMPGAPRPVGQGQTPNAAAAQPQGPPQGPQGAPQGGDLVTIQAPTGETKQVPRQAAQLYVQRDPQIRIVG